ncbi:hypothetical protein ACJX0J_011726, partial [Zea mays]
VVYDPRDGGKNKRGAYFVIFGNISIDESDHWNPVSDNPSQNIENIDREDEEEDYEDELKIKRKGQKQKKFAEVLDSLMKMAKEVFIISGMKNELEKQKMIA